MNNFNNFSYILEDWGPIVNEYAKFLKRYGLDTIIVLIRLNNYGIYEARLFADEDKYLELATKNTHFILEENQIKELLEYIKILFETATVVDDEFQSEEDYDEDDEYYIEQDLNENDDFNFG